jgi:hypothetical protein
MGKLFKKKCLQNHAKHEKIMLQTYIKLQRRKDIKIIHAACIYTTCLLVQYPVDVLYCIYVTVVANLSRQKL